MFRQALDVAFDSLFNVVGRFGARSPLRNTARQSRTCGYKHSVLVLFQVDPILHHPHSTKASSCSQPVRAASCGRKVPHFLARDLILLR